MRSTVGKLLMGELHGANIVNAHGTARERQVDSVECRPGRAVPSARAPADRPTERRKAAGCFHSAGLGDVAPFLSRSPVPSGTERLSRPARSIRQCLRASPACSPCLLCHLVATGSLFDEGGARMGFIKRLSATDFSEYTAERRD